MEGGSKDERDQHPPELRSLVVAEASRAGIWAAMERYGIPSCPPADASAPGRLRDRGRPPAYLRKDGTGQEDDDA